MSEQAAPAGAIQNAGGTPSGSGGPAAVRLLVCVPTYNEAENIAAFLAAVFENVPDDAVVLVIDDNSPDGTAGIVEGLQGKPGPQSAYGERGAPGLAGGFSGRLYLLRRPEKQGLGAAYLAAFAWGLERGYGAFLEIDADFSHNPAYIPAMLHALRIHDVVIGSRNIRGGGVEGWGALRAFVSKGGSLYARLILGCPIKDLTGGFNLWRREALEKIGLEKIISMGYSFQVEMKYRAWRAGCSAREIPIMFVDRKYGVSKMSGRIFAEALINVWKIRGDSPMDQFVKFALTGGLGTVTNLVIFFVCVDLAWLPEIPVSVLCFLIAGTQNYFINHRWTFSAVTRRAAPSIKKWFLFMCGSLAGLAVNVLVMTAVIRNFAVPYKAIAQAAGIAAGMAVNFIVSKLIVFRRNLS